MPISPEKTRTLVTIPKDLKKTIEEEAKRQNRSFNNLVITILEDFVENLHK